MMKAAVVTEPGKLELLDLAMPIMGPYDCLVKIDACAVCSGTDSHITYGSFPWRDAYPFVVGHESTGIILERGPKVKNFEVGQRVTRPGGVLAGQRVDGIGSTWGGFAEYGLVRDTLAAAADGLPANGMLASSRSPVPNEVGAVSAALSVNQREILSLVSPLKLGPTRLGPDARVAVVGSGYNGLLFALFCKHFGAGRVVVVGSARNADRALENFGADDYVDYRDPDAAAQARGLLDGGVTHVIDAVGSKGSLEISRQMLGPETAFGCYGIDDITETAETLSMMATDRPAVDMATREADFVTEWAALWRQGFFNRPGMCDQVLPLAEIHQALELVMKREAVKVVITM
jgi:NADPH:quinone reductase-like Zn-dependent oxidoreductase